MPVQDIGHAIVPSILCPHRDQRTTAAHRLGVDVGMLARHTHFDQCPDQTACSRADSRTGESCNEGSRSHDRPDAGNCHHTEARQQSDAAAQRRANRGTRASCGLLRAIGDPVDWVLGISAVAVAGIVGDQADVARSDPGGLQLADCALGLIVVIEQCNDCGSHAFISDHFSSTTLPR